jgi:hypothetical protein
MKNKLALVTCYYQHNYGSQLQAYATQRIFDEMGIVNETICIDGLKRGINKTKYWYFLKHIFDIHVVQDKFGFFLYAIVKKIKQNTFKQQTKERSRMFTRFSKEMFHISPCYSSKKLIENVDNYTVFILGSDQLWLPSNIEADYYTLNFVPDKIPKIALATSFGVAKIPSAQKKKTAFFLNRFDHISVREISGQKIIKELTNRDIPVVCDPTLLFTAQDWLDIQTSKRIIDEKYILCYFLGSNIEHRNFAKKMKAKLNLKIVQLQHLDKYVRLDCQFPDYAPYNIGPAEFISLIRDAEYILTDSFHCTIFSLLYKKRFFSFKRYHKDSAVSTNSRLYSLLSLLHLESFLLKGNEEESCLDKSINYDEVHAIIAKLRNSTINYLKDALNKSGIVYDKHYK